MAVSNAAFSSAAASAAVEHLGPAVGFGSPIFYKFHYLLTRHSLPTFRFG